MILEAGDSTIDTAYFLWQISDICQYECSYCTVKNDRNVNLRNKNLIELTLQRLKKYDGNFVVEMYGGEPTTHPNLVYAVDTLNGMEHCINIEILTNLRRNLNYFRKLEFDSDKITLTPSYHPEYHEGFIEKAVELNNYYKGTHFMVYVMLSDKPEHWDNTEDLLQAFDLNNVKYSVHLLVSTEKYKVFYTPEFFERFGRYIKDSGHGVKYITTEGTTEHTANDIIVNNLQQFKGYHCRPLMHEIDINGNIYNACFKGQNLPLFFKKDSLMSYKVCPNNKCYCDIMFDYHKVIDEKRIA